MELATGRSFDQKLLAKVITVLSKEGKKWFNLKSELIRGKSQLIISPLFDDSLLEGGFNSYQRLLIRKSAYSKMLLEITKRRHLEYLASVGLTLSPEKNIFKWHPLFKLDEVDIEADLRLLPVEKTVQNSNANTILRYFVPLSNIELEADKKAPESPQTAADNGRVQKGKLKGVSLDLLAKVSVF